MSLYCPKCKTSYSNSSGLTVCKACKGKLIKINKKTMENEVIECPICGCGIERGNHINGNPDKYECSVCGHIGHFNPKNEIRKQHVNIPKCPTCHSANIVAVSQIKREFSALLFGIANPAARAQFECKNCGYRW